MYRQGEENSKKRYRLGSHRADFVNFTNEAYTREGFREIAIIVDGMLRVFHLVKGLGRGGAETLLVRTAETGESGIRTGYGYFLPWKDALVSELRHKGCTVKCFPAGSVPAMVAQIPALVFYLKAWRPDVIHCHLPWAGIVGRVVGKILGIPVVYTEHNLQERYHRMTRLANGLTWRLQNCAVAVSDQVRSSIQKNHSSQIPLKTVLNGIDCEQFRPLPADPELMANLGLGADDIVVGTVAVFRAQKRLDHWLSIAKNLAQREPRLRFLLVGDGPLRGELEALALRLGLADRCLFVGLHSEIRPYLSVMDVFLMTSEFEGLPVAMLEAMACGLPVVATSAGGIPEVIQDPSQGIVRGCDDFSGLESAVFDLISDQEYRERMGQAARQRVVSGFGMQGMRESLREIYYECSGISKGRKAKNVKGYSSFSTRELKIDQILELMKLTLGPGSCVAPRSPEFWNWKHESNVVGPSYGIALTEADTGLLASLRVFMRFRFKSGGESEFEAVRAVDTATHPTHQGKGLFRHLTEALIADAQSKGASFVFNTPNSNSLPGYLRMGWELVEAWPLQVRWMRHSPGKVASTPIASPEAFRKEIGLEELLSKFDSLLEKLRIPKTVSYLSWRYGGHPSGIYRLISLREHGRLLGLAILRLRERNHLKEVMICELLFDEPENVRRLIHEVVGSGLGHYIVACFPGQQELRRALRESGFLRLPMKEIPFTVLPLNAMGASCVNPENWHLSTGDLELF